MRITRAIQLNRICVEFIVIDQCRLSLLCQFPYHSTNIPSVSSQNFSYCSSRLKNLQHFEKLCAKWCASGCVKNKFSCDFHQINGLCEDICDDRRWLVSAQLLSIFLDQNNFQSYHQAGMHVN